jgi:hypothetical protein
MSGQLQAVLLDSNAYFRLACSIRPLLKGSFGDAPPYTMFVLADLDEEYRRSIRLQHKFQWVVESEYRNDRTAKLYELNRKKREEAERALRFLADFADDNQLNVSLVDLKALAVGFVDSIPVVTDDGNMTKVAEAHDIECWNTIKLLKLMCSTGRIDDEQVAEVLEYLQYEKDLPMPLDRLRKVFKEYFGKDCPI